MRACPLLSYFGYSTQCYPSRILAYATSQVYAFRLRSINKTYEIEQLVIFAHVDFLRSFRGVQ